MTTSQELTAGSQELTVGLGASGLETTDMVLNIGPQHPATHGVLRLRLVVNGERIVTAEPIVGYMHRGAEKLFEVRDYRQIMALANRHDWLSGFANELGVALGVEAMLGMEVPERATWTRTLLAELTRVMSHLMFLGSYPLELGAITPIFYSFREREELRACVCTSCSSRGAASRPTFPPAGLGGSTRRSRLCGAACPTSRASSSVTRSSTPAPGAWVSSART